MIANKTRPSLSPFPAAVSAHSVNRNATFRFHPAHQLPSFLV
jgi:hypothetical protein